jgi:translation initiation factor IF-3
LINRPRYRVNQYIRVPQLQLIDELGKPLGVVPTVEALKLAQERGLDLVEVNPTAQPPIAKLIDFGQFQYKQQKQAQAQKAKVKKVGVKGVRLSLKIGEHDKQVRLGQAQKFLDEGHRVRLEMILRGREKSRGDLAREIMQAFITEMGENVVVEVPFSRAGGNVSMQVARKKS